MMEQGLPTFSETCCQNNSKSLLQEISLTSATVFCFFFVLVEICMQQYHTLENTVDGSELL